MASDAPERVFCRECGAVNDGATAQLAEARETIANLETDMRSKRATNKRLLKERDAELRVHPRRREALGVLEHWRRTCKPSARELDAPDRMEKVIARLNAGYTVDQLKRVADGYARRPFIVDPGRRVSRGKPSQWHADAELVYRSDRNVQQGLDLADDHFDRRRYETELAAQLEWETWDWRKIRRANHQRILSALRETSGSPGYDSTLGLHYTDCPRCGGGLEIYSPEGCPESLLRCGSCPIDETSFFAALRDDEEPPAPAPAPNSLAISQAQPSTNGTAALF